MRTYVIAAAIIAAGIGWAVTVYALRQANRDVAQMDHLRGEVSDLKEQVNRLERMLELKYVP